MKTLNKDYTEGLPFIKWLLRDRFFKAMIAFHSLLFILYIYLLINGSFIEFITGSLLSISLTIIYIIALYVDYKKLKKGIMR